MPAPICKRVAAEVDGPFVVFLIGARINRWWKPQVLLPFFQTMPRMLGELAGAPELGLLHARTHFGIRDVLVVQYWRSFDALEAWARDPARTHQPAWAWFNRAIGSNGDIGIWHETYLVQPGAYEAIYNNMPPFGLGAAGRLVDAKGARAEARTRLRAAQAITAA